MLDYSMYKTVLQNEKLSYYVFSHCSRGKGQTVKRIRVLVSLSEHPCPGLQIPGIRPQAALFPCKLFELGLVTRNRKRSDNFTLGSKSALVFLNCLSYVSSLHIKLALHVKSGESSIY